MSSKRPGTVDYSKWDNFECSDSESEESTASDRYVMNHQASDSCDESSDCDSNMDSCSNHDSNSEYNYSDCSSEEDYSSEESEHDHLRTPTLSDLQRAWTNTDGMIRRCANCFTEKAPYRCSRCQLVRYCNAACQKGYHFIHKMECIDVNIHASFWGLFDKNKNERDEVNMEVLIARRASKRRRALQRAAAAAAIERARLARVARGQAKGGGKGKNMEEREEECCICTCEFTVQGDGGVAFCCPTSHYMCNECCGTWIKSVMGNLETSYPPKCPLCKAGISKEHFERQLTSVQQGIFRTYAARMALKEGEELIECEECGEFEVRADDPVIWWCPHCQYGVCRVCSKGAIQGSHDMCAALHKPKALIEEAIEEGSKMRCPSCQLSGRKDDACTHMTCTKCSTEWCYVCGLDVEACDKAQPREGGRVNDIYLHNRDWEVNESRCPMYLTQILEVDLNWLGENWEDNATDETFEDDERCLDYFHRFRTLKLLQVVREEIGDDAFINAFNAFDSIKNCGYTYFEVISTCTEHLIDRREFIENYEHFDEGHVDNEEEDKEDNEGETFTDRLEQEQIELVRAARDPRAEEIGDEDDSVNPMELEERLVTQALQVSMESAAEDEQTREVMARSADTVTTTTNSERVLDYKEEIRDEDDDVDPLELEQKLVTEALQVSMESVAEDEQIRELMARSADSAAEDEQIREVLAGSTDAVTAHDNLT